MLSWRKKKHGHKVLNKNLKLLKTMSSFELNKIQIIRIYCTKLFHYDLQKSKLPKKMIIKKPLNNFIYF